ncbi:diguanylate cyclase [Haliea sp. E1-2-M8]|uniref:diguanylate cyclase domain-containing protein n=1 Tax=Haliea sp. E1-2-M8 TaxID=3064706 RepID=UPI00272448DE|nr:diguanylate cyclase [Haliea sp. E1-2-M8]MDO8862823.1 diguanylate cyclase [Haliea sp. E1-2-M8]
MNNNNEKKARAPGVPQMRLTLRSAALILAVLVGLGLVFLCVGILLLAENERDRQSSAIQGLINTVERTAEVAMFLQDSQLAAEVVAGLEQNSSVLAVIMRDDQGQVIAGSAPAVPGQVKAAGAVLRAINSPFTPEETIGSVELTPDLGQLELQVINRIRPAILFFLIFLVVTGATLLVVLYRQVTRPIQTISRRLHRVDVTGGEHIAIPRHHESNEIGTLVGDVNRIIDRMVALVATERDLRLQREREEARFRAIFDNAGSPIFLAHPNGALKSFNLAFARTLALDSTAEASGQFGSLYRLLGDSGEAMRELVDAVISSGRTQSAELEVDLPTGKRWYQVLVNPVSDDEVQGIANDITEHKLAQEDAEKNATTDSLTGIGNRLAFDRRLAAMFESGRRRTDSDIALMMLDLDHFKELNDTHGHQAGDQALIQVAERLQRLLRSSDCLARLGGDEFAIILDGSTDDRALEAIADKIIASLNHPLRLADGARGKVGVSIGIAVHNRDEEEAAALVKRADAAMYEAKAAGRNTWRRATS